MATAVTPRRFTYSVLGPAILTGAGGARVGLRTRKIAALLYLMARQPGVAVSRDWLVELLWSEDEPRRARHSLTQGVSLINKALGREIVVAAGKDQLRMLEGSLELDVAWFERHIAEGRPEEARSLWRGALLDGLWIQRAPNFEQWLGEERNRLVRLLRAVLRDLIESRRVGGDWAGMRTAAEALIEVDPLDEGAMLAYLEALVLLDDRTLALRRYGEFEGRLKEELQAEPGQALQGWVKRHRRADHGEPLRYVPRPAHVSETQVLPAARPLFGRDKEFAQLWEAWEAAKGGVGSFLIVEGEAGIGKTALAAKLANQIHVAGGSVCFVRCYRTEKAVPFAPVTAMIRQVSRLPGFVAMNPVWIGELTRLVPELRERYPNAPPPLAIDDSARHRLCDATVSAAEAVGGEHPLLLVVDDIHDADEASLALVHYLGRQAPGMPVVLLCNARLGVRQSELERTFFATARSAEFARFLELSRLTRPEIERIAGQVLAHRGMDPSDAVLAAVLAASEGNPLHAIEAALSVSTGDGLGPRPASRGVSSFDESSLGRLTELDEQCRHTAAALAVAGRPLSDYELAVVTGLPPAELASSISRLEVEGFVRRSGDVIAFAHERYQAAVDALTPEEEKAKLHLRLANHLVRAAARNPSAHFEVAKHLLCAGDRAEAVKQALAASEYAASIGAVGSRAEALQLALEASTSRDAILTTELGNCYLHLDDQQALEELLDRAPPQDASERCDQEYLRLSALFQRGELTCSQLEQRILDLLAQGVSFTRRADAKFLLMRIADKTRHYSLVKRLARELRAEAADLHGAIATGYVFVKYYSPRRAMAMLERGLALVRKRNDLALEQLCRDGIGVCLKQLGRFKESMRAFELSVSLARKTMNPQGEAAALHNRAVSEIALGDFESAKQTLMDADRLGGQFKSWVFNAYRRYNDAIIDLAVGDFAQAAAEFEAIASTCERDGLEILARQALGGAALARAHLGDLKGLERCVAIVRARTLTRDESCTWIDEIAIGFDDVLNRGATSAVTRLQRHSRQLRRRDIAFWLWFEVELLHLQELVSGTEDGELRHALVTTELEYGSRAVSRILSAYSR